MVRTEILICDRGTRPKDTKRSPDGQSLIVLSDSTLLAVSRPRSTSNQPHVCLVSGTCNQKILSSY